MKKLVFLVLTVLTVGLTQGAQISWKLQADSIADAKGAGLGSSVTVYLVAASNLDAKYNNAADIIAAASGAGATFTIGAKSAAALGTYAGSDLALGGTLSYYLVMVDSENNRYTVFGSYTSSAATADGVNDRDGIGALMPAVNPTTDTFKASLSGATWNRFGGGVPEPTSGLLFLVGGAMLALRRRRNA